MSLPTFEPIGHAVPHSLQEAAGMMRNTETHEVELRPHRYLRECDVLKEMRMIKDKLDEYEERQDAQRGERMRQAAIASGGSIDLRAGLREATIAHNSKEAAALRAQSEAMTAEGKLIEELKARIAVLETALRVLSSDCLCWVGTASFPELCRPSRGSHNLALAALAATEPRP